MEFPLSSSGMFSQDLQHCLFSKRFKTNWKLIKQVLKNWKSESSSCPCSTILIGQREKKLNNVFRIPNRSRNMQEGCSFDRGHSSDQEKITHGMECSHTQIWRTVEWNRWCHGGKIWRKRTSDIPRYQCVKSRSSEEERWNMYDSLHCRIYQYTIHSANQVSIFGAVASWCEELAQTIPGQTHMIMEKSVAKTIDQLYQKLELQEVDS